MSELGNRTLKSRPSSNGNRKDPISAGIRISQAEKEYIKKRFSDHRLDPELYNPWSKVCCFSKITLPGRYSQYDIQLRGVLLLRQNKVKWRDIAEFTGKSQSTLMRWLREEWKHIKVT